MEDTEKPTPKRDVWERVKARREREGVLDEKVRGVPTAPLAQPPSAPVGVVASSSTAADDDESFGGGDGADLVNYLEGRMRRNKPLTDAQVEKLRKRQRAEGVLSGISDAVRSVVNLGYTNKYAPNMYDATKSMSAKTQARFDKEKAERDARDADYYNDVMALTRFKQGLADRAYQRGRDARKDAEEKAKSDNAAKISEIKYRKAMGELDDAEAAREEYAANKEYRDALAAAKLDEVKSRAERNRRPNAVRSGGGSGKGYYFLGRSYPTKETYRKAVLKEAYKLNGSDYKGIWRNKYGIDDGMVIDIYDYDKNKPLDIDDIAARVEDAYEQLNGEKPKPNNKKFGEAITIYDHSSEEGDAGSSGGQSSSENKVVTVVTPSSKPGSAGRLPSGYAPEVGTGKKKTGVTWK